MPRGRPPKRKTGPGSEQETATQMQLASLLPEKFGLPYFMVVSLDDLPENSGLYGPKPSPEFIESIKNLGIFQPIVLIASGFGDDDKPIGPFKVEFGRRRIKAARIARDKHHGPTTIDAMVYQPGEFHEGSLLLIENKLRSDNEAADLRSIEKMIKEIGGTEKLAVTKISDELGIPVREINAILGLRSLNSELRNSLDFGYIEGPAARVAAKLSDELQMMCLDVLNKTGVLTAADVRNIKKENATGQKKLGEGAGEDEVFEQPDDLDSCRRAVMEMIPMMNLAITKLPAKESLQFEAVLKRVKNLCRAALGPDADKIFAPDNIGDGTPVAMPKKRGRPAKAAPTVIVEGSDGEPDSDVVDDIQDDEDSSDE